MAKKKTRKAIRLLEKEERRRLIMLQDKDLTATETQRNIRSEYLRIQEEISGNDFRIVLLQQANEKLHKELEGLQKVCSHPKVEGHPDYEDWCWGCGKLWEEIREEVRRKKAQLRTRKL